MRADPDLLSVFRQPPEWSAFDRRTACDELPHRRRRVDQRRCADQRDAHLCPQPVTVKFRFDPDVPVNKLEVINQAFDGDLLQVRAGGAVAAVLNVGKVASHLVVGSLRFAALRARDNSRVPSLSLTHENG